MTKKVTTKGDVLSVSDILQKKGLTEDYSFYYSQFFGKKIEIEKISASKIIEVMNKEEGDEYEKYKELIYLSCPLFRAKELIKELEVDNPYDVVGIAFNDNYAEVFELGNRILQRYGFTSDRLDRVKKQ